MPGPHPAVAATRVAVRDVLAPFDGGFALVACSGGPDSLALAAAVAFEAPKAGVDAGAVVIDHGLQDGSEQIAQSVAQNCSDLGLNPVVVITVEVAKGGDGGPEARARKARYSAFDAICERLDVDVLLLGHTLDDQAEQVLLALARGSGARSLAAMSARRGHLARPFLGITRSQTELACREQGLSPWRDPHNDDPTFRRVRVRRLLGDLEKEIGPGIAAALARSADLLRVDADTLDELAMDAFSSIEPDDLWVDDLLDVPPAVRSRVWRLLAIDAGSPAADVSATHVAALEALLTHWHGQGGVDLPGGLQVYRTDARIRFAADKHIGGR